MIPDSICLKGVDTDRPPAAGLAHGRDVRSSRRDRRVGAGSRWGGGAHDTARRGRRRPPQGPGRPHRARPSRATYQRHPRQRDEPRSVDAAHPGEVEPHRRRLEELAVGDRLAVDQQQFGEPATPRVVDAASAVGGNRPIGIGPATVSPCPAVAAAQPSSRVDRLSGSGAVGSRSRVCPVRCRPPPPHPLTFTRPLTRRAHGHVGRPPARGVGGVPPRDPEMLKRMPAASESPYGVTLTPRPPQAGAGRGRRRHDLGRGQGVVGRPDRQRGSSRAAALVIPDDTDAVPRRHALEGCPRLSRGQLAGVPPPLRWTSASLPSSGSAGSGGCGESPGRDASARPSRSADRLPHRLVGTIRLVVIRSPRCFPCDPSTRPHRTCLCSPAPPRGARGRGGQTASACLLRRARPVRHSGSASRAGRLPAVGRRGPQGLRSSHQRWTRRPVPQAPARPPLCDARDRGG